MPPALAVAGIAAAGAVGSAAISSKATKKAAQAQTNATAQQIAATNANRDYQYNLNAPTIANGAAASDTISGLLNTGGNPTAAASALNSFRASSGYQDLLNTGLAAVNSNAYARGLGDSGATLKALQTRGASIADQSQQGYINNLMGVANLGGQARGLVAGVGTNSVNANNAATQTGADATANAIGVNGSNLSGTLQKLTDLGTTALGSSYSSGGSLFGSGFPTGISALGAAPLVGGSVLPINLAGLY